VSLLKWENYKNPNPLEKRVVKIRPATWNTR